MFQMAQPEESLISFSTVPYPLPKLWNNGSVIIYPA